MKMLTLLLTLIISIPAQAQIDNLGYDDADLALTATFYALDRDQLDLRIKGNFGYVEVTNEDTQRGGYERCRRFSISSHAGLSVHVGCLSSRGFWELQGFPLVAGAIEVLASWGSCQQVRVSWKQGGWGKPRRICWNNDPVDTIE